MGGNSAEINIKKEYPFLPSGNLVLINPKADNLILSLILNQATLAYLPLSAV